MYVKTTPAGTVYPASPAYHYQCDVCPSVYVMDTPPRSPFRCNSPACDWSTVSITAPVPGTLAAALQAPRPAPSACYASLYGISGIIVQDQAGAFVFLAPDQAVRIEAAHIPFLGADVSPPKGRLAQDALAEAVRLVCAAHA